MSDLRTTSHCCCCYYGVHTATPRDLIYPLALHAPRLPAVILPPRGFSCCCTPQLPQEHHPPCMQLGRHHRRGTTMVAQLSSPLCQLWGCGNSPRDSPHDSLLNTVLLGRRTLPAAEPQKHYPAYSSSISLLLHRWWVAVVPHQTPCLRLVHRRVLAAGVLPSSCRNITLLACSHAFTVEEFRRWWHNISPCCTGDGWLLLPSRCSLRLASEAGLHPKQLA